MHLNCGQRFNIFYQHIENALKFVDLSAPDSRRSVPVHPVQLQLNLLI